MYIMKMGPAYKDYIWGGTKLKTDFNKKSDLDIIAESWELSCHPNGKSIILNGAYKGMTLDIFLEGDVTAVLGSNCEGMTKFPLLIKLIDAQADLSIQVHPDDELAFELEADQIQQVDKTKQTESGKTEVWIVLDCEPESGIYYGFNRSVSKEELSTAIKDGTILELLNNVKVKKGDVFFIKPGTIHALGAGTVIAEIQQNSDITYRLYDYNRRDANGEPRPLHIEKSILCADLKPVTKQEPQKGYLVSNEYFMVKKLTVSDLITEYAGEDSFQALLIIKGEGLVQHGNNIIEFIKGDCLFVLANTGEYEIKGNCEILLSSVGVSKRGIAK